MGESDREHEGPDGPGSSLALVCAAKGYGLDIVFSDAFSDEKRRTIQAFGATVVDAFAHSVGTGHSILGTARAMRERKPGLHVAASVLSHGCGSPMPGQRLGPGATVATVLVDSGLRYLSTDVFRP